MASAELKEFLSSINEGYVGFAEVLHAGTYTDLQELGAADKQDLVDLGVPRGAAGVILAKAVGAGEISPFAPATYFGPGKNQCLKQIPPAAFASFENYKHLQTTHDLAPFFLSGRPATAESPPLALCHEVFGEFLTDAAQIEPAPDTFDFVLEACGMLANFYSNPSIRQQLFNSLLAKYLSKDIYLVSLAEAVGATDGSIVDDVQNPEFAALHIDYMNDLSTGTGADPSAKILVQHYCLLNRLAPKSRIAASPCFGLVVIGPMLWIYGLAFVGKLACQPLTPMFHMLDLRPGQRAYMEQLARAFEALRRGVTRLVDDYAGSPLAVRRTVSVPYPLLDSRRWSDVQKLTENHKLLFFARDRREKMAKVVKYVTKYGIEVHQALSDIGLAPVLYEVQGLKGGFLQVVMELLGREDGWYPLDMLPPAQLARAQPAVLAALEHVHTLRLPGGGFMVLADCRPNNIIVKIATGDMDVRFIDFDWAGEADVVRYPSFLNRRDVPWHEGVKEFAPVRQMHDTHLLQRYLARMPISALQRPPVTGHRPLSTCCAPTASRLRVCRPKGTLPLARLLTPISCITTVACAL